tara:strand:- start:54 stop:590 length:537 start_codon:yes stop_codon:yes gene_type:complete
MARKKTKMRTNKVKRVKKTRNSRRTKRNTRRRNKRGGDFNLERTKKRAGNLVDRYSKRLSQFTDMFTKSKGFDREAYHDYEERIQIELMKENPNKDKIEQFIIKCKKHARAYQQHIKDKDDINRRDKLYWFSRGRMLDDVVEKYLTKNDFRGALNYMKVGEVFPDRSAAEDFANRMGI